MKVEFYDPADELKAVVATATWDGRATEVVADSDGRRRAIAHAFRPTAVVSDDASLRRLGTHGPTVIVPGDLAWFRAAAQTRVLAETGLIARVVADRIVSGFDPAAGYRPFSEQVERLTARSTG